jgi:hypothetical protein
MIEDGTTEYRLQRPFKYSHKGASLEAEFCELFEPGMEHVKYYLKLKQMIVRAQLEASKTIRSLGYSGDEELGTAGEELKPLHEDVDEIEKQAAEGEAALAIVLQMSESVDICTFVRAFSKLCFAKSKKNICMVDGNEKMTEALFDRMHPEEAFNLAVRWCNFFVTALAGQEENGSRQPSKSATVKAV